MTSGTPSVQVSSLRALHPLRSGPSPRCMNATWGFVPEPVSDLVIYSRSSLAVVGRIRLSGGTETEPAPCESRLSTPRSGPRKPVTHCRRPLEGNHHG
jgi:hypothetical protein